MEKLNRASNFNRNKKSKVKKQRKKIVILSITAVMGLLLVIGATYAFFQMTLSGTKNLSVVVGTFQVAFTDGQVIDLNNTYPISDSEGLETNGYTFTVRNTGNVHANYLVKIKEEDSNTLSNGTIKIAYKLGNGSWSTPVLLSSLPTGGILVASKALNVDASDTYTIKLWMDEQVGNEAQNKLYKSKIVVESVQGTGN